MVRGQESGRGQAQASHPPPVPTIPGNLTAKGDVPSPADATPIRGRKPAAAATPPVLHVSRWGHMLEVPSLLRSAGVLPPPPNPFSHRVPAVQPRPSSPAAPGAVPRFSRTSCPPAFLLREQKQPGAFDLCPSCLPIVLCCWAPRLSLPGASLATSWSSGSPHSPLPHPAVPASASRACHGRSGFSLVAG